MAANDNKPKAGEKIPALKCPICRRATEEKFRPFCSQRCADVDLSRWLTGVYAPSDRRISDVAHGDGICRRYPLVNEQLTESADGVRVPSVLSFGAVCVGL